MFSSHRFLCFRNQYFCITQSIVMKRSFLFLLPMFALFHLKSAAQAPLKEGGSQLNAGVGISGWGIPVYLGFDYGIAKDITLGGELSLRSYGNSFGGRRYRHTIFGLSGNGNYHFNSLLEMPSEWNLYAGLNLGFYVWNSPSGYDGDGTSGIGLGLQVGGRYFLKKNLALNLELGGATVAAGGKFGITYLLN